MRKSPSTRYTLRQVIDLTGVSEFTLRGWELRYQAVTPQRSPSGRRLYKHEDLLKLKNLKDLVARGYRIGKISGLTLDDLQKLLEERELLTDSEREQEEVQALKEPVIQVIRHADKFDWNRARKIIEEKKTNLEPKAFILNFLLPLIKQIGHQVHLRQLSIAQEHILTAFIKESLYSIRANAKIKKSKKIFIICTPEGDFHELGILMASTLATVFGFQNLYLGPNVPKAEICETCLRFEATHLLISSTWDHSEGAKEDFLSFIHFVDRHVPKEIHLWIAGRNAQKTKPSLKRTFRTLQSIEEFSEIISKQKF